MLTATLSEFRRDMKNYVDRIIADFETLIINRGKNKGLVVMSLDEYNSIAATRHEISSRENEKRLDAALNHFNSGKAFEKELIEE